MNPPAAPASDPISPRRSPEPITPAATAPVSGGGPTGQPDRTPGLAPFEDRSRDPAPPAGIPDTVVGIDVGGARKGFHAVALRGGAFAGQLASPDPQEVSHWCRAVLRARLIAIDAPCRWSSDGRPRPCERELMAEGIRCFASPTRATALAHPSDFFGWMLRGEALYQALEPSHPLLSGLTTAGPACFETFPHAITWQLRGGNASAALKRPQRLALLKRAGIDPTPLTSIDRIDAALCALAAQQVSSGAPCRAFGASESGLIVVPQGPLG